MDFEKKLSSLQELSKLLLSRILGANNKSKYLILEPKLIKSLENICGVKWLKSKGVEKIFKLDDTKPNFESRESYYMIHSNFITFKKVIDQIRSSVNISEDSACNSSKFNIIVVPFVPFNFEKELEEFGLFSSIKLHSFQWMPFYPDTNLLTLNLPMIFGSIFLQNDLMFLPTFSKTLWRISMILGNFNFVLTLGEKSNKILSQLEHFEKFNETQNNQFGGLIMIDRSSDLPSALLTPCIYSGLLKEVEEKENILVNFNSETDSIYAQTKNKYFTEVTTVLCSLTKELNLEKETSSQMQIDELKKYVKTQLGRTNEKKKYVANHVKASENIIEKLGWKFEKLGEIEFNIMNNLSKSTNFNYLCELILTENEACCLRLFCLILIVQKLTENEMSDFFRKFLHKFGFKHGHILQTLTNAGIIPELPVKSSLFNVTQFYQTAKNLKQFPTSKIDLKHPTCPSYVFRGNYVPLVAKIAGMVLNSTPLDELRSKMENVGSLIMKNNKGYPLQSKSILVCVVGGVTYAEISALNFVESLTGSKIIVLSDNIINGNDLMNSIIDIYK